MNIKDGKIAVIPNGSVGSGSVSSIGKTATAIAAVTTGMNDAIIVTTIAATTAITITIGIITTAARAATGN